MIIVDTSVWIDFLNGELDEADALVARIEKRKVLILACIAGELLQGARTERETNIILKYWWWLPKFSVEKLWVEAGEYAAKHKLFAQGIGLIDAVIVMACYRKRAQLWTHDKKIKRHLDEYFHFSPQDEYDLSS